MNQPELPDDLRKLDAQLRAISFEPRASLAPEVRARASRTTDEDRSPAQKVRLLLGITGGGLIVALVAAAFAIGNRDRGVGGLGIARTVDHCCRDLDGGGSADDGILILTSKGEAVRRLLIYEDGDGTGSYSEGDLIRFHRGATPVIAKQISERTIIHHQCCMDYDGGGHNDDGLIVVGVPPDIVLMAAIYETGGDRGRRPPGSPFGYELR